jgi:hypothetical protein
MGASAAQNAGRTGAEPVVRAAMQISPTRMRVYRGRIIALLLNGCGVDPVQRACSSDGSSAASRASAAFIAAEVNFWG